MTNELRSSANVGFAVASVNKGLTSVSPRIFWKVILYL